MAKTQRIFIIGDVTIDWHIAHIKRDGSTGSFWNADDLTQASCQVGGAGLLISFLATLREKYSATSNGDFELHSAQHGFEQVHPLESSIHHSYAMWEPCAAGPHSKEKVWRINEFLGLDRSEKVKPEMYTLAHHSALSLTETDVLVIDDANLGCRESDFIPSFLEKQNAKPWIVLKMAKPIAEGKLWRYLHAQHRERLIVIFSLDDLRKSYVHISRKHSWERTAQDTLWELSHNPRLNSMSECAHVIVSSNNSGAIHLRPSKTVLPDGILFFDAKGGEGDWENQFEGRMIGYTSCMVSALVFELIKNAEEPKIGQGIANGIRLMRELVIHGFGNVDPHAVKNVLQFPADHLTTTLLAFDEEQSPQFQSVRIKHPSLSADESENNKQWTILEANNKKPLSELARDIARNGLEAALPEIPIGKFGFLTTVDRKEIEAFSSVRALIEEYCQGTQQKPLSIAVFGPPGSGKSFAVKQIIKAISGVKIKDITFNLSQFSSPKSLWDAMHQVRDLVLSGVIPLVFWDEFDAAFEDKELGWLRYFLAPMQDGEFQDDQIVHPIGRCIFVFAGGTSTSFETFSDGYDKPDKKALKLPDFISRLKGFLNILGPNPVDESDHFFIIRRAILLDSMFSRLVKQILIPNGKSRKVNIDEGVLRAFLHVSKFKHGARSMESIIHMSHLSGKTAFERSSLPSETQLNVHVDGEEFYALMQTLDFSGEKDKELLEKLAREAHAYYNKLYGDSTSYDDLTDDEKAQNRDQVFDIPNKLKRVGYIMKPIRGTDGAFSFSDEEVEILAMMEHDRWVNLYKGLGWTFGKKRDPIKKHHECLQEWQALSDTQKEKDRAFVRWIPHILNKAGFTAIKIGANSEQ